MGWFFCHKFYNWRTPFKKFKDENQGTGFVEQLPSVFFGTNILGGNFVSRQCLTWICTSGAQDSDVPGCLYPGLISYIFSNFRFGPSSQWNKALFPNLQPLDWSDKTTRHLQWNFLDSTNFWNRISSLCFYIYFWHHFLLFSLCIHHLLR